MWVQIYFSMCGFSIHTFRPIPFEAYPLLILGFSQRLNKDKNTKMVCIFTFSLRVNKLGYLSDVCRHCHRALRKHRVSVLTLLSLTQKSLREKKYLSISSVLDHNIMIDYMSILQNIAKSPWICVLSQNVHLKTKCTKIGSTLPLPLYFIEH